MKNEIKGITITEIFEGSALNRDEKIGGNIPAIKKLTRKDGTYSYLSKVAMRHYLWCTLNSLYPEDWKPAECTFFSSGDKKVVQFDITKQNILTHAELDAFGYMFTIGDQKGITRKAPVGITKAVSLEIWEGDMQFNANHELVRRCPGSTPSPVNKEEHYSFYKFSFNIDVDKIGKDEWWIEDYNFSERDKKLVLSFQGLSHTIENVERVNDIEFTYKINNEPVGKIKIGELITIDRKQIRKVVFEVDEKEKLKRIKQILNVIKNGIIYHSSGECYGIVPKFLICSALKLPLPIFHSFVYLGRIESSIFENDYIFSNEGKKLIYIYNPEKIAGEVPLKENEYYSDWNEFLNALGLQE